MRRNTARFFATGFGVSYAPAAILKGRKNTGAGFLGTLVAVPLTLLLPVNPVWYAAFLAVFFCFAVWMARESKFEQHDDPRIVIDEMAGYFFAMFMVPRVWQYMLAAFILFRILDTAKPLFIRRFDRMDNAWGVVLDDVAGGISACVLIHIFMIFWR